MGMCPVCNGLNELKVTCNHCHSELIDYGRMMDYGEKYDAYMPIELQKLDNGIKYDQRDEKCIHYVVCPNCQEPSLLQIKEW
ncbi:hypothetical protein [Bacillus sp. JCM 19034]|uniref:hypothetical protein n=1 Tax=Bacillus sp. JCM 19034 TaxID=1481928 RepID=UPI000785C078|nr:hypothetical protein [Bacillus sp. JCM 19034]